MTFATLHCRNCDGRFSCRSYREYVANEGSVKRSFLAKYVAEEKADDGDQWVDENIAVGPDEMILQED